MKKLALWMLILTLFLGLAGCASKPSDSDTQTTVNTEETVSIQNETITEMAAAMDTVSSAAFDVTLSGKVEQKSLKIDGQLNIEGQFTREPAAFHLKADTSVFSGEVILARMKDQIFCSVNLPIEGKADWMSVQVPIDEAGEIIDRLIHAPFDNLNLEEIPSDSENPVIQLEGTLDVRKMLKMFQNTLQADLDEDSAGISVAQLPVTCTVDRESMLLEEITFDLTDIPFFQSITDVVGQDGVKVELILRVREYDSVESIEIPLAAIEALDN